MSVSPFDSALLGPLLSDPETANLLSDEARVNTLIEVEEALARAEEVCGIVPFGTARAVARAGKEVRKDVGRLAKGAVRDGTLVPALVVALRESVGKEFAPYVHRGATSQDIEDTAFLLRIRAVLDLLSGRIGSVERLLASHARGHGKTIMAGRTRFRQSTPITFGLKLASWRAPLVRHRQRLDELRSRLLVVQLGGASGTLSAFDGKGIQVMERFAREFELGNPVMPWHTQRDSFAELAGWFSLVSGSLGKMGLDLCLLAESEVDEVQAGPSGGSSTMPHKSNPVGPEMLVALARMNASLLGGVHQAALHEHERSGAGLALEWLSLPSMAVATGASLLHSHACVKTMKVDPARMRKNIASSAGTVFSEALRDALAQSVSRDDADRIVRECIDQARQEDRQLLDVAAEAGGIVATAARHLEDLEQAAGSAKELLDRALGPVEKGVSGTRQKARS